MAIRMDAMRKCFLLAVFALGFVFAGASFAQSQQRRQVPSLGDLARRMRDQRAKEHPQPAKLYTNDNLPRQGALSEVGPDSAAPGAEKTASADTGSPEGSGKSKSAVHDEDYYRQTMKELASTREMHQRELTVLEQKLSQNQTQYYGDPQKTLDQELSRSDIQKKQDDIEKKKQQIAADDQAISDLQTQCQREGCPAGWLR